jgi:hypothetical protein
VLLLPLCLLLLANPLKNHLLGFLVLLELCLHLCNTLILLKIWLY